MPSPAQRFTPLSEPTIPSGPIIPGELGGKPLGAAGAVEAAYTALALHHQTLPPTINLDNLDPECEIDHVANTPRKANIDYAISNAFGFGGTNSALVLGKA